MSGASSCYTTVDIFCFDDAVFIIFMDLQILWMLAKTVPIWIPFAPSMNAAAIPLPSAIPPAAITGIFTASTTCGTSTIVVSSPICPPASHPSATTASAPQRSIRLCKCYGCYDRNHFNSGCFPVCHVFFRASGSCGHDFHAFFHNYLRNFF